MHLSKQVTTSLYVQDKRFQAGRLLLGIEWDGESGTKMTDDGSKFSIQSETTG